jgi:hypothetical protein
MTTLGRTEQVAGLVEELRPHVIHTCGVTILSGQARDELAAFVTLMATEIATRSRNISSLLEAYFHVLSAGGRADATNNAAPLGDLVALQADVDLRTAAELIGFKEDTLRRALREKRINGALVNGRWRIPVSAINEIALLRAS